MRHTKRNYLFGSPRHAKLQRLKAKGMLPTKEELAKLCAEATATIAKGGSKSTKSVNNETVSGDEVFRTRTAPLIWPWPS